jgi:hypothetical protein
VPDTDHESLTLPRLQLADGLGQRRGRQLRVTIGAHGERVAVGTQAGCRAEVELGPRRVDEVVVLDALCLAGPRGVGVDDVDEALRGRGIALGVQGDGLGLTEVDAVLVVDRPERERHLLGLHATHPDPDVRGDPVPLRVGRHHHHLVRLLEQSTKVQCSGVAGYPGSEDDYAGHVLPLVRSDESVLH